MIDYIFQLINIENTFIGEAPIGIDDCQWIRLSGGNSEVHFAKGVYNRPILSVYARGLNNQECSERINLIFNKLKNHTTGTSAYIVRRMPTFVGKDSKHRSLYSFQLECQIGG